MTPSIQAPKPNCATCPDRDYWEAANQWECTYTPHKRIPLIGYPYLPKWCKKHTQVTK